MNSLYTLLIILLFPLSSAFAGDFKWSGAYRFEGLSIKNPEVSTNGLTKSYMLQHLILKPEIVAYDGLTIRSRFDIFNNPSFPNSQLGQLVGSGVGIGGGTTTNQDNSDTLSQNQAAATLAVTQLYAVWNHEFGALTVGRAPIHFGLGMTFNAGNGPFDHWMDNRDLVAYKVVFGNFFVMPVIAKVKEGSLNKADDVDDYILQAQYENPETELAMGAIYQARRSSSAADSNDTPLAVIGNGGTQQGNFDVNYYNFFVSQWVDSIKIAFEIGFAEGATGIFKNGAEVEHKGFGAALKLNYLDKASSWVGSLDIGFASGDDPSTDQRYEGYAFDRNYDIAFLMFNHPLGQTDFLRTGYLNNANTAAPSGFAGPASSLYDVEAISNTIFGSIGGGYKFNDKYFLGTQLTYAQLNKDPLNSNVDSGLGFEVDLTLKYTPFEGFQWINRAGVMLPGGAFSGGTNKYQTDSAYGIETKAAISF